MIHLLVLAILAQPCPNRAAVLQAGETATCAGVLISQTMADRAVATKAEAKACAILRQAEGEAAQLRLNWAAASAQMRQAALLRSTVRVVEAKPVARPWYLHPVVIGLAAGTAGLAGGWRLHAFLGE
jgi:hypothetical protein